MPLIFSIIFVVSIGAIAMSMYLSDGGDVINGEKWPRGRPIASRQHIALERLINRWEAML